MLRHWRTQKLVTYPTMDYNNMAHVRTWGRKTQTILTNEIWNDI